VARLFISLFSHLLCSSPSFISLTHKRKKIMKCGELFAHSYSCGVAQQCDWLTTLPLRTAVGYSTTSLHLSDARFYHSLSLSLSHSYTAYTSIYGKPFFFLPPTTFFISSRYKFIPLTFSFFLPSVSLHFQSTTVLDNASIRF